jgi:hypothetical protein
MFHHNQQPWGGRIPLKTSPNVYVFQMYKHWKGAWKYRIIGNSLKEGWNLGIDTSLRILSIESLLAPHVLEPILKVGWNFGTFSFHFSNFERILGFKIRHANLGFREF